MICYFPLWHSCSCYQHDNCCYAWLCCCCYDLLIFYGNYVIIQNSQLCCVFSSDFLGDLENYTFLKTRWYKQSENQCFHLHRYPHGGHLGFFKMAAGKCIFVHISASKCHWALMLTPKTTFSGARSPMAPK